MKWIFSVIFLAIFCRIFLISVYRISTDSMSPTLMAGDVVIANQLAYGFQLPWMSKAYFESMPQIGDIVVFKVKNKTADDYHIKQILKITDDQSFQVSSADGHDGSAHLDGTVSDLGQIISRDQILSRVWFIGLSVGSTQDSISAQKTIRWNRFLTIVK